ncbi:MAG: hypothetical protein PHV30_05115 [Candidatus Margulisbacteria bacterium]|nr:hypothetical protein [Candidatus Margulisiibacteriota bacterium]
MKKIKKKEVLEKIKELKAKSEHSFLQFRPSVQLSEKDKQKKRSSQKAKLKKELEEEV